MTSRILHGCLGDRIPELIDEGVLVDSIVTDPPYHLTTGKKGGTGPASVNLESPYGRARVGTGFMGMTWDGGDVALRPETWSLALDILKPGGHLLAFGGTRTHHRLMCAIEDAGFELRDVLMWVYSSGFPKSMNSHRLKGEHFCDCESTAKREVHPMRDADVPAPLAFGKGQGPVLQHGVQKQGIPTAGRSESSSTEARSQQSSLEGWGDIAAPARELRASPVCESAGVGAPDGAERRVCDGAPPCHGAADRSDSTAPGNGASLGSCAAEQRADEFGTVAGQQEPQTGGAWPICRGCGKPIIPAGLGTALKPAWEPIILARKPLAGTVADNMRTHGVGMLDIDGCRVAHLSEEDRQAAFPAGRCTSRGSGTLAGGGQRKGERTEFETYADRGATNFAATPGPRGGDSKGRWPANLAHDGSDEVLAAFPDAPSQQRSVGPEHGAKTSVNVFGDYGARETFNPRGVAGSAARFYYCAKADRTDRNEGCENFQTKGTDCPIQNHHPTVKPINLMRWLIRMVTPKGGLVLDPFAGSGSTGKATVLEGRHCILIEREAEYIPIIQARLAHAQNEYRAATAQASLLADSNE